MLHTVKDHIERKQLQRLGEKEAELSTERVNEIIDRVSEYAAAWSDTAKDKFPEQITPATLKTIQQQINENIRRLTV